MPDGRARFNPILWAVENINDLPPWFMLRNERIRVLTIQKPEIGVRLSAAKILAPGMEGYDKTPEPKQDDLIEAFARSTEAFTLAGMVSTTQLAKDQGYQFANILDAVQLYKLGVTDNPWKQSALHELIGKADTEIERQVKGQRQAVVKTVDILRRSVMGLSGAQASADPISGRPRGVLFFAGPTGVGKTELAKAISKLLFGNADAYIRFDMSEFAQEHTEARLIGSPPGYVGHFQGGELTRAIQTRPFSVVLFDEIEKAHPRILDKFLQILEDGRLTDGQGVTAYFSEAIIVFTSNLGIYVDGSDGERVENVNASMEYEEIERRIRLAIENYFKYKLVRPEILNRLGDNIVVFNFITPDIAKQIFDKQLDNIRARIKESRGLSLEITPEIEEKLINLCTGPETLANGGRGIGNRLETVFVNPISRALFDLPAETPGVVRVTGIKVTDGVYSVKLT
jgi:ATP-dependent Clp protease ATP-binding subunit ClpA